MSGKGDTMKKLPFDQEDLDSSDSSDSSDDSEEEQRGEDAVDARLAQNADDSDEDSDDSESDMEVDDEEVEARLAEVNEKLLAEPYNYDLLVTKIGLLRISGNLEALREAREKMSQLYPLSEQLWLEWLQDEKKLSETPEEKKSVVDLFERAVQDYLSVKIWLEYIQFSLGQMGEEGGIQNCRDVCERAVGAAGLHVSLGSLLWDAYRDVEAAILGCCTTEADTVEQEKRYIGLCKRQLSVPLLGMEEKFAEISGKIDIDEATREAYEAALKKLQRIESFEQELILAQADAATKAAVYKKYIQVEQSEKSNPARIQCLYERAVADCPLDSSLWLEYIQYLQGHLKIPELIWKVVERASRNCPWVLEVWAEYLVVVEKHDAEKLLGIFEKAVANFATAEQVGTLWLKYLESLRRLLRSRDYPEADIEKFVKSSTAAENHILQLLTDPEPNDFVFQVIMMRLRLLASTSKKLTEIRESWKGLLQRGYGYAFRNWLQYLLLEKDYGDLSSYRQQLSKAVSFVKDDLHSAASLWLNFERDNGDVSQLHTCEKKINKFMLELSEAQVAAQDPTSWAGQKAIPKGKEAKKRKKASGVPEVAEKRKKGEDMVDGEGFKVPTVPTTKPTKDKAAPPPEVPIPGREKVEHDHSKDDRTAFVSNLAFSTDESRLREFFKDVGSIQELRLVKDFKGRSKGYAYVVFDSRDSVSKALALDRHALEGRPVFVNICDPDKSTRPKGFKFPTKLEKNKLFIKGLATSINEEQLRNLFSPFGLIKDIRIVTFRNGFSKGIAYVEYEDEASANAAVKDMNDKEIEGKNIIVAISNPPPKQNTKNVPSDMQFLQRRAPTAFVPRSLQMHKTESSANGNEPRKPMSNEDFKKLLLLKQRKPPSEEN